MNTGKKRHGILASTLAMRTETETAIQVCDVTAWSDVPKNRVT